MSKWKILLLSAKWDRIRVPIYEATARGKHIPLLKTLLSNACTNECKYCMFRRGYRVERRTWDKNELVRITLHLWRRGIIKGIFLSSGIIKDPETTSEKQIEVAEELRRRGFTGYIHLRLMPGIPKDYVWRAAVVADRAGVNLETTSKHYFSEIAPDKGNYVNDVLKRLEWFSRALKILSKQRESLGVKVGYLRAGIDTQVMVGVVGESDLEHLKLSEELYRNYKLTRIYFSPFEPIIGTPFENKPPCPLDRVKRLYQATFLLRDYGFTLNDLKTILGDDNMLPDIDPKVAYAKINKHMFPVNINEATFFEIVRIPGIGPITAKKILEIRNIKGKITFEDLSRIVGRNRLKQVLKYITF